jgi:cyclic-di-GMP phosphodiesterase, flagellum assembly factor TipF
MSRLGTIFVIGCMVLIAASGGAVLYLLIGLGAAESATIAIAVLTALAIYNAATGRVRDRSDAGARIADLAGAVADLARQTAEIGRRTTALEAQRGKIIEAAEAKAHAATSTLVGELGELGSLVKQLAETVAAQDGKIAAIESAKSPARVSENPQPIPAPPSSVAPVKPEPATATPQAAVKAGPAKIQSTRIAEASANIRAAVEDNRVELFLQPIVTLPQRKTRYYEGLARLRTKNGALLNPPEFLDAAESQNLMPAIDKQVLFHSAQIIRRLKTKNRDVGLFCNIASSTLNDKSAFPEILQFLDANRALAPSLILEFKQSLLRNMGPLELESLSALRELGLRFCMDGVADLRMEPRELSERGIRFVKAPAQFLLKADADAGSDIHAADLSDLLARFSISLIAERIETETQVVDLLDHDVRFGQGFLFSPPRPIRNEHLAGSAEAENPPDDIANPPRRAAFGRG